MLIVREYQQVYTEYLVDTDDENMAYLHVEDGRCVEIDVSPVFAGILKREARDITYKDRKDPVFQSALYELEYKQEEKEDLPVVEHETNFFDKLIGAISD